MVSALNASLSGFNAASTRLDVAASNIANAQTKKYTPVEAVQTTQPEGGVETQVRPRENVEFEETEDESGGGRDIARDLVDAKLATYDAKANLNAVKVANETLKSVLDIIA